MGERNRPRWAGAFAAYFDVEPPQMGEMHFWELYSPLLNERERRRLDLSPLRSVHSDVGISRTFEVWFDGSTARIFLGAESVAPLNLFRQAYRGIGSAEISEREPPWVCKLEHPPIFFDAELAHALPFTHLEPDYGAFMNRLIASLDAPTWIQMVFAYHPDAAYFAEAASMRWQAHIAEIKQYGSASGVSSTVAAHGGEISREYFEKSHSPLVALHLRGLCTGRQRSLSAAFNSVNVHYDELIMLTYTDARALRWMRARSCPIPDPFLKMHANGGFLCEWGRGREFIPTLILTPDELSNFIHLPTDPSLPVSYARARMEPRRHVKRR